jgi:hypothetical protein
MGGQGSITLPILQLPRRAGVSSWAGQLSRTFRIMGRYLRFAWAYRLGRVS